MNREASGRSTLLRRAGEIACSGATGAVLLAMVALYLGIVSVAAQAAPGALESVLGVLPRGAYSHWILVVLTMATCASLIAATVVRVPLDLPRAGTWCAHLGVLVLAIGAAWYGARAVRGECVSVRQDDGDWTPMGSFHVDDLLAVYVAAEDRPAEQTPLGRVPGGSRVRPMNVPLGRASEGVEAHVTGLLPHAVLTEQWTDDSPNALEAVEIDIALGRQGARAVLSPHFADTGAIGGPSYAITYDPRTTPAELRRLMAAPATASAPAASVLATSAPAPATSAAAPASASGPAVPQHPDVVYLLAGEEVPPTVVLVRADGTRWQAAVAQGKPVEIPLASGTLRLTAVRFLTHARRTFEAVPAPAGDPAGPAARVEFRAGEFAASTWVEYVPYADRSPPRRIDLPGGRVVYVSLSRRVAALPEAMRILDATYESHAGSLVPKDYRCTVRVGRGGGERIETLSLNRPFRLGRYQISQGSWQPAGADPRVIRFLVSSQPGLPVVWAGLAMIATGMPWAFFVKPWLLRRRGARA